MQIAFPSWRCSICSSTGCLFNWLWVVLLTVLTGNGNVACITNEFRFRGGGFVSSFDKSPRPHCFVPNHPTIPLYIILWHKLFFHILPGVGWALQDNWRWQASFLCACVKEHSQGAAKKFEGKCPGPLLLQWGLHFGRQKIYEHHCHASNKCQKVRQKCGH